MNDRNAMVGRDAVAVRRRDGHDPEYIQGRVVAVSHNLYSALLETEGGMLRLVTTHQMRLEPPAALTLTAGRVGPWDET